MMIDFDPPIFPGFEVAYLEDETSCLEKLVKLAEFSPEIQAAIAKTAEDLVRSIRDVPKNKSNLEAFLQEYDLSSQEGIALMCLAEALLRVPDTETIDDLIRDKLTAPQWGDKLGQSDSLLVNASTWALMLTGKVLSSSEKTNLGSMFKTLLRKSGEPVIRRAVSQAMKILGRQFVMGRTMSEALKRACENEAKGYRYSYDMLGEAARTAEDAERYFTAYLNALEEVGKAARFSTPAENPGISVKLSALHPRYYAGNFAQVVAEVAPKLLSLAQKAKFYKIGLTVDAEEARVLELSLAIIEKVFVDPSLADFEGLGVAVQSYQKRAPYLIDWLIQLAQKQGKRWMVRLIKGAYWDSEIKYAQVLGLSGYPVFTRKSSTDVSFIACAKKILAAPQAFYAQFGSHNAYSVAVILELAQGRQDFEFQCLHGMGQALYDGVVSGKNIPCRIYAPVGSHKELLAYLVRRLLENGANTSFVNRVADESAPIADLIQDPIAKTLKLTDKPHPRIPLPRNIYGPERVNAQGWDASNYAVLTALKADFAKWRRVHFRAGPLIDGKQYRRQPRAVLAPFDYRAKVGDTTDAELEHLDLALSSMKAAEFAWNHLPVAERAQCLKTAANLLEKQFSEFLYLAVFEAGKTIPDAIAEVREAIDFCRYYAHLAEQQFEPLTLPGPTGELNQLRLEGRGSFVCISPWNFPLAIFMGQVTAALVTGNCVAAKPSEQTTLMATAAVKLLHEAGIPKSVLQLLPGKGEIIGAHLVQDPRIDGVIFTGSTQTAKAIQLALAKRAGPILPFIAETGGQNVMIVDSTALLEQVVDDVLVSAFGSAGQRCSALRVLYIQEDIAEDFLRMLKGTMATLKVGHPGVISTDVGPVIDGEALQNLKAHLAWLKSSAKEIATVAHSEALDRGNFFCPCAYEIKSISELTQEVFGPCVHVIRFKASHLENILEEVHKTGFGLTQGLHTRIDARVEWLKERSYAGNLYVNRNMVGAVVGVQPFGGEGLSGTGPKAGGPHYLLRLVTERTLTINTTASGGNASLLALQE